MREVPREAVAVLGVGTVGLSWTALFLSYGQHVRLWDPQPGLQVRLEKYLAAVSLERPLPRHAAQELVTVCATVEDAVMQAFFVQENSPENMATKRQLLNSLDECCPPNVIIGSSTSSFLLRDMIRDCKLEPGRFVLTHPFNPPHLMPLVELFGTVDTSVEAAASFYSSVGRHPIIMRKQLPGHIANRLTSAIFREAVWMLKEGIASVEDIDAAMSMGPGMRFAHMGPFQTYHLAAGDGGIAAYLEHLGPSQEARWLSLGQDAALDEATKAQIVAGVNEMVRGESIASLARNRDKTLMALLGAKGRL
jgi:carnitine 3-dehydrogenase